MRNVSKTIKKKDKDRKEDKEGAEPEDEKEKDEPMNEQSDWPRAGSHGHILTPRSFSITSGYA